MGTAVWLKQTILNNGYVHCSGADTHMAVARYKVYVLDDDTCRRLTREKESRPGHEGRGY